MGFKIKENVLVKYIEEKDITEAIIPEGITVIGTGAFEHCKNLKKIIIPESVIIIGKYAFNGCVSLESVVIPNRVNVINGKTFKDCKSIKKVAVYEESMDCYDNVEGILLPKSVQIIYEGAFYGCVSLESVTISEKVFEIGVAAFSECTNLEYLVIPKSVFSIGGAAFDNTKWLEEKQKENSLVIVNNILIDGKTCEGDIVIPEGVTEIVYKAFHYCEKIKSIVIPKSVSRIGAVAFLMCKNLESVTLSEGIVTIDSTAFRCCEKLNKIEIPESIKYIDDYTFDENINLIIKSKNTGFNIKLSALWGQNKEEKALMEFFNDRTEKNFVAIKKTEYKIPLALLMMFNEPSKETVFKTYVKRNIKKIMKMLIDNGDIGNLVKLLPFSFVTAKNIDEFVLYANEKKQIEMQMKLMNYKNEYIGYKETVLRI